MDKYDGETIPYPQIKNKKTERHEAVQFKKFIE